MTDTRITLSDTERAEIEELLRNNEKLLAIKLLCDQRGLGLPEAKSIVEAVALGQVGNSFDPSIGGPLNESVNFRSSDGQLKVSYTDGHGVKKAVVPTDPEWSRVKVLLNNNASLAEYEKQYLAENIPQPSRHEPVIVDGRKLRLSWPLVTAFILVALAVAYFMSKF